MSDRKLRVGVAGATGALGRQILRALEDADLPLEAVVPMASAACTVQVLEVLGHQVRVENLLPETVRTCDLLYVAVPRKAAAAAIRTAREAGVPVIDASGVLGPAQGVPLAAPALGRESLCAIREQLALAAPRPDALAVATLLAPLRGRVQALSCRGLVLHSASSRGRAGVEEFSSQVVSLFNSRSAPRKVFPLGLAFDVEPAIGEPAEDGWTPDERRLAAEAEALAGLPQGSVALGSLVGPWFNGLCLALQIRTRPVLEPEAASALLDGTWGLQLDRKGRLRDLPRPRAADGSGALRVGRLRADPAGDGLHLWAAGDEVGFAAAHAAATLAALVEDGLLDR